LSYAGGERALSSENNFSRRHQARVAVGRSRAAPAIARATTSHGDDFSRVRPRALSYGNPGQQSLVCYISAVRVGLVVMVSLTFFFLLKDHPNRLAVSEMHCVVTVLTMTITTRQFEDYVALELSRSELAARVRESAVIYLAWMRRLAKRKRAAEPAVRFLTSAHCGPCVSNPFV
jgi:hypothetical protein